MSAITLYMAGGFATAPNFMSEFGAALSGKFERSGVKAAVRPVFPYGDWSRPRWSQLAEIQRDLAGGSLRRLRSVGGTRLAETIGNGEEPIILIGHSAGGMASVHAARFLLGTNARRVLAVIQIGSPKCRIPSELQDAVLYLHSVNRYGRRTDPVTRLGWWGRFAPSYVEALPLVGGHKDYFRNGSSFADEQGRTNLFITLHCVWNWLQMLGVHNSPGSTGRS